MKLRHLPTTSSAIAAASLAAVAGLGVYGMGRSLWLDEAWVANSVQAPSLSGMFYYPGWIQINPPLFLLLVRAAVRVAGASSTVFRIVPLLLACTAAIGLLALSRRLLTAPFATLATAIVALNPNVVEFSRTLKPFAGELAAGIFLVLATVRYVQQPDRRRFAWLLLTVAVAIPLAYPSVFVLPGIALAAVSKNDATSVRRGAWLCAIVLAVFAPMWWFSIRPNLSPQLHQFWAYDNDSGMNAGLLAALLFFGVIAVRTGRMFLRGDRSARAWAYLLCVLPCLLLAASGALGLYPVSHRTRLFALPFLVLLAALTVEDLLGRFAGRPYVAPMAAALTCGLIAFTVASQIIEHRATPEEDFYGAVAFLQRYAAPSDVILVHACCQEGFLLYSGLGRWSPPHLRFGDTGWPCCARGKDSRPGASSESAVIRDLDAKVPPGFAGRVWLLYTTRPTHWSYTGLNEGELWRKHLWDRGCPPGPYLRFSNLALSPMNCAARQERTETAAVYSKTGR